MTEINFETSRTALAFARAFIQGDASGANELFVNLPVDELPGFASSLAMILANALEVSNTPPGPFFDAMADMLDRHEAR